MSDEILSLRKEVEFLMEKVLRLEQSLWHYRHPHRELLVEALDSQESRYIDLDAATESLNAKIERTLEQFRKNQQSLSATAFGPDTIT